MNQPLPAILSLHDQLLQLNRSLAPPRRLPCNVFPPGIVVEACTYRVWRALLFRYPRSITHGELRELTGLGRGAVSWALRYLHEHGVIERFPVGNRAGWLRYRANLGES